MYSKPSQQSSLLFVILLIRCNARPESHVQLKSSNRYIQQHRQHGHSSVFNESACYPHNHGGADNVQLGFSQEEKVLRFVYHLVCNRLPTMSERSQYYNQLKTGEISETELASILLTPCGKDHLSKRLTALLNAQQQNINNSSSTSRSDLEIISLIDRLVNGTVRFDVSDWSRRMPNQVYAWTVDFHASPAACNIPIYRDIGVVLHPEVDHHPNCDYTGFCKNRMKVLELGAYMAGFALDPDNRVTKSKFYQHYQNDSEFNRIDVFMCSHPAANCELFEMFQKPMVVFATTRLEFGRDDQNIGWRRREMSKWNAWGELKSRQREWISFIIRHHQAGKLAVTANSAYDAEYVRYFTGVPTEYIPSWCGDWDSSYGGKKDWVGCIADNKHQQQSIDVYKPTIHKAVIAPYKQYMWAGGPEIDRNHAMYKEFDTARSNFTEKYNKTGGIEVVHSNHEMRNHSPEKYRQYKAIVFVPYQTSVMTFFELYRQNIPIFSPNLDLLVDWHQRFRILAGRIYGHPERHTDLIANFTGQPIDPSIPNPNDDMNRTSNRYWFKYSDTLVFPHVVLFESWLHLFELLETTNLTLVSENMAIYNRKAREDISNQWDKVFQRLVPSRRNRTRLLSQW